jgi:HlyD family secretion protein
MPNKKKRGWFKWLLILLLLGGGAFAWWKYRDDGKTVVPQYKTDAVTRGPLIQSVTANGQLSAVKNVQVGSQISGIIKELHADFNSRVKEGDVIARIDPSTYERAVEQAEAELASAKAQLQLAESELRRARELRQRELLSAAELDQAENAFAQGQATVKLREASLKRAKVDLERTTIYAPISGLVITRAVDVGQTVAASLSAPTLFIIAQDLSKMQIDAMVSEADVGGVIEGQRVQFSVDAFPGRQFEGTVKQVRYAPTTNQNVVTYATIVDVGNEDLKLRPGMTANASIITAEKPDVLKVPNAALRFRPPEGAQVITNDLPATVRRDGPPSGAGEGGGNREEMRRRFESMSPEERERFRAQRGSRGPRGSGSGGSGAANVISSRVVYVLVSTNGPNGKPVEIAKAVPVKVGVSDGIATEVIEGLKEGDAVVTSAVVPGQQVRRPTGTTPFGGPPFGGGGGMRPR